MISFRQMTMVDIPTGLQLCRAAGWNQVSSDWELFLKCNPEGARVVVDEQDRIVGTVTTIRYGGVFGWIGMLLVDPAERRKGLGTKLLVEANTILSGESTIRLDATSAGREVYRQFGFNDELTIARMQRASFSGRLDNIELVSPVGANDMDEIMSWDARVFAADRRQLLQLMHGNCPALTLKIRVDGRIVAYCFGREGYAYLHVGPVVATSTRYAVDI
ncbi:MAG TPA: GNAT family N-acetyltransferase, partial [Chryseolinea sp.]|nr:GNAT family N-acetyltransferase [Chryseolinea sp.]